MKILPNSVLLSTPERRILKALIDRKYGKITSSIDYESTGGLHDRGIEGDVYRHTGKIISGSTLERLVGLTREQRRANMQTIDMVARYLDFPSSRVLLEHVAREAVTRKKTVHQFSLSALLNDHLMVIRFGEDREVHLRHSASNRFEVVRSENSRIRTGDRVELGALGCGEIFRAHNVFRRINEAEQALGTYSSGVENRVREIVFMKVSS